MSTADLHQPLAARMRPRHIDQYIGQPHLMATGKPLRIAIERGKLHSMILWGPPGTGKTTLAQLLSTQSQAHFLTLSAVLSGVKDIRQAMQQAQQNTSQQTILFIDEVHRFNKAQQDAFLPYVEDGTITFIGATTENPAFELINPLLSRARVYRLKALTAQDLTQLLTLALTSEQGLLSEQLQISDQLLQRLANAAQGDARRALNLLEITADLRESNIISDALINEVLIDANGPNFDKGGDAFYQQISALHKSVRGSAPDAALYWLTRMLTAGCDPLYIARRVVRMASEDIGNADPRALRIALDAWDVVQRLGAPEGDLSLAQAVLYLACAAKSNAVYNAFKSAQQDAHDYPALEVPMHLCNAPANLLKEMGYGQHYRYAHDEPEGYAAGENYFPDVLQKKQRQYYHPVERGLEIKIKQKLAHLKNLDNDYS